jgi:hypothetical protein
MGRRKRMRLFVSRGWREIRRKLANYTHANGVNKCGGKVLEKAARDEMSGSRLVSTAPYLQPQPVCHYYVNFPLKGREMKWDPFVNPSLFCVSHTFNSHRRRRGYGKGSFNCFPSTSSIINRIKSSCRDEDDFDCSCGMGCTGPRCVCYHDCHRATRTYHHDTIGLHFPNLLQQSCRNG